jgi:hypothetical protein
VAQGFRPLDLPGSEHQLPLLSAPSGLGIELHRHLPGLRPGGAALRRMAGARGARRPPPRARRRLHPRPGSAPRHAVAHGSYSMGPPHEPTRSPGCSRTSTISERRRRPAARARPDLARGRALPGGDRRDLEPGHPPARGALPGADEPAGRLLSHLLAGALDMTTSRPQARRRLGSPDRRPPLAGAPRRRPGCPLPTNGQLQAILRARARRGRAPAAVVGTSLDLWMRATPRGLGGAPAARRGGDARHGEVAPVIRVHPRERTAPPARPARRTRAPSPGSRGG